MAQGADKLAVNVKETVTQPLFLQDTGFRSPGNGLIWRDDSNVYVRTGGQSLNLTDLHQGVRSNRVRVYPARQDNFNLTNLDGLFGRTFGSIGVVRSNTFSSHFYKAYLVVRGKDRWYYRDSTKAFDHAKTRTNPWESVPQKRIQLVEGVGAFDDDLDGTGDVELAGGWSYGKIFIYENGGANLVICNRNSEMPYAPNITDKDMISPTNVFIVENVALLTNTFTIVAIPIINMTNLNATKLDDALGDGVGCIGYNKADNRVYYSNEFGWWYI